jgi:riboflavin kinase / FMN adenylyltransferase
MSEKTAITIGNFDGVHLGHQALIEAAHRAVPGITRVVVLSFDPHPITVLKPAASPARLSTFAQRKQWISEFERTELVRLAPTREYLSQTPAEFVQSVVDQFKPMVIVEGQDFRFGKGRAGTVETIRELGKTHSFATVVVDPVERALADQSIVRVSSSLIRWLLACGRVADASMLLGRPFEMSCAVKPGDKRGRTIGFPTANLDAVDYQVPGDGIYAGTATIPDGRTFAAAISVGTKPTFGEHARVCEAFLIDYDGPLDQYEWIVHLQFHHWLRDQLVYPNAGTLIEQLHRDVERTQALVAGASHNAAASARMEPQAIA